MNYKKTAFREVRGLFVEYELAVAAVNCLTLVLLTAPCSLLDEVLAGLGKSVAEIAAAAETHLCENFLNVRLNDHSEMGKWGRWF